MAVLLTLAHGASGKQLRRTSFPLTAEGLGALFAGGVSETLIPGAGDREASA